ncbi:hypothetical protein [Nonomuraea monospora]|uniref:hypothetical protein n=1 Tax=Nonomuraea monospora TaxID=568818 RepID=UPI0031DD50F3
MLSVVAFSGVAMAMMRCPIRSHFPIPFPGWLFVCATTNACIKNRWQVDLETISATATAGEDALTKQPYIWETSWEKIAGQA